MERCDDKESICIKVTCLCGQRYHSMIWNGLEMLPVVQDNMELIGIISRRDVMKAMQLTQRQPQVGNTFEDDVSENLEVVEVNPTTADFSFTVTPQMTNNSWDAFLWGSYVRWSLLLLKNLFIEVNDANSD